MKRHIKRIDLSILAPLLLFTVFALCVITVLLTGAKIYRNYTARDQTGYDHRTVAQYITTRIRQSDACEAFFVGDFSEATPKSEGDTFFFCEVFGDETYYTRIYCHDGYLYELFALAGDPFEPCDGEKILAVGDLHFAAEGDQVTVEIEYADGSRQTLVLHMRSRAEVSQ